ILVVQHREEWKGRKLQKGAPYKFPSSKGANPAALSLEELQKILSASETDVARALIAALNIAPALAEAACEKAGVEKSKKALGLSGNEAEKLFAALKELYTIDTARLQPVLAERGREQLLLPFMPGLPGLKALTHCSSLNEALDNFYSEKSSATPQKTVVANAAERKKAGLVQSLCTQELVVKELQQRLDENARKGEAVYIHYQEISALLTEFKELGAKKMQEKEVMYKLSSRFPFLKKLDLRDKRAALSLPES
ncbi:MAG: NFACT family protein, partial [Candidatus Diapherotrites archaeon]|nr:NFACT family protein [Candidatus Diapherotrites archaeon]